MTISRYRGRTSLALILIVALALAMPVHGARAAGKSNPGVLPPNSHAYGKTYGGWAAAWWQWALSISAHDQNGQILNPLLDGTGARCGVGQSGPVFFLVGSYVGPGTRTQCVVPAGKALFFPLIIAVDVHVPCSALNPAPVCDNQNTNQAIWNDLENTHGYAFRISALHASIDGVPVGNLDAATTPYRACAGPASRCSTPSFSVTVPGDHLFGIASRRCAAARPSPRT